jgi:hypothetical protein
MGGGWLVKATVPEACGIASSKQVKRAKQKRMTGSG